MVRGLLLTAAALVAASVTTAWWLPGSAIEIHASVAFLIGMVGGGVGVMGILEWRDR